MNSYKFLTKQLINKNKNTCKIKHGFTLQITLWIGLQTFYLSPHQYFEVRIMFVYLTLNFWARIPLIIHSYFIKIEGQLKLIQVPIVAFHNKMAIFFPETEGFEEPILNSL